MKRLPVSLCLICTAALFLTGCPARIDSPSPEKRLQALAALTDQAELARIAQSDPDRNVREAAWLKVTDEKLLARIASETEDAAVFVATAARISNEGLLAGVVISTRQWSHLDTILERITEPALLMQIGQDAREYSIREQAIARITEPALLGRLALETKDVRVRTAATTRIDDQSMLARIAATDPHADVREAALRRLTNEDLLRGIITGSPIPEARGAAHAALGERLLAAGAGEPLGVAWNNLRDITDEVKLARCALSEAPPDLREAAVRQIKQLPLLAHLATQSDPAVALTTMETISDPDVLSFLLARNRQMVSPAAELKLALRDPRVVARHPVIKVRISSGTDTQTYESGSKGGRTEVLQGKTLRMELLGDPGLLAAEMWQPDFPYQIMTGIGMFTVEPGTIFPEVRIEDLLAQLLAREEFTQADLVQILHESSLDSLRLGALANLTDETVLAQMAAKGNPDSYRRAALHNLHDQDLLAAIAGDEKEPDELRRTAVENLTDQPALARIASRFGSDELKRDALSRLTDPVLLRQVAKDAAGTMIMGDKIEALVHFRLENLEKPPPAKHGSK